MSGGVKARITPAIKAAALREYADDYEREQGYDGTKQASLFAMRMRERAAGIERGEP